MHIRLNWIDLVAGYDRLCRASHQLPSKWRAKVMAAYARKLRRSQVEQEDLASRRTNQRIFLTWLGGGFIILGLAGAILWRVFQFIDGFCLLCLSVPSLLIIGFLSLNLQRQKKSTPPYPLSKSLRSKLFPNTLLAWKKRMKTPIPNEETATLRAERTKIYGLTGEYRFLRAVEKDLSSRFFILHNLQQNYGDDLDVVVVSPRGIWLFEIKYWSGKIRWKNGQWYRRKNGEIEMKPTDQAPCAQWLRMRDEILKTLRYNGSDLMRSYPTLENIGGGIVFTHEDATYDIPSDIPVPIGDISGWIGLLGRLPKKNILTPREVLQVIELLLTRHQEINKELSLVSADGLAVRLIKSVENEVEKWIKSDTIL